MGEVNAERREDTGLTASNSGISIEDQSMLARVALSSGVPVKWSDLQPVVHAAIDAVLSRFAERGGTQVGPPPPMLDGSDVETFRKRLHALLEVMDGPPFTMQRLAELLLGPEKQYSSLPKLASALEKLLMVVTSAPVLEAADADVQPLPPVHPAIIARINDNPPSHYVVQISDGSLDVSMDTEEDVHVPEAVNAEAVKE
ncbi:hypothetical protein ACKKBG_A17150 [Auxenochlorella protothecoides x Auxenochlorella symbiontica]